MDNIINDKNNIIVLLAKDPNRIKFKNPIKNVTTPSININLLGLVENEIIPLKEYLISFIRDHLNYHEVFYLEYKVHI